MSAMEMMLANMIGLKPQEMKEMAERIQTGFLEMAGAIKRIEDNQIATLALLEEQNARGKSGNNGDGGNPKPEPKSESGQSESKPESELKPEPRVRRDFVLQRVARGALRALRGVASLWLLLS